MLDHEQDDAVDDADDESAEDAAPAGMTDEAFKTLLGNEIRDALGYIDSEIAPERTLNYQYFLGQMDDVPAIEGRSSVVVRVVADHTAN